MSSEQVTHLKCDRCGKEVLIRQGAYAHVLTKGWNNFNNFDFCPDCSDEFDDVWETFISRFK